MAVTARSVPILKDNYAWLLRDTETGATAIVDPAPNMRFRALQVLYGGGDW